MASLFIDQIGLDCGELLWEWSNAQTMYDRRVRQTGKQKLLARAYAVFILAGMLGWFLYSFITTCIQGGFLSAFLYHLPAVFGIIACGLILLLSTFGLWGKFLRFALRKGLTDNSHESRQLAEQVRLADENRAEENAVRIYPDYIVVINKGKKMILDRAQLRRIVCTRGKDSLTLSFHGRDEYYNAYAQIPAAEFPAINKLLRDLLDVQSATEEGGEKETQTHAPVQNKVPVILFLLIFVGAGAAVIALHYTVIPDVPVLLGAAFIAVACILILALFSEHAVIGKGIVPLLLGLLFTAIPVATAFTVAHYMRVSFVSLLERFTIVHAVLILFLAVGPIIAAAGIKGIVDSVKYRK